MNIRRQKNERQIVRRIVRDAISLKLDPVLQGAITVSDALTCKYS